MHRAPTRPSTLNPRGRGGALRIIMHMVATTSARRTPSLVLPAPCAPACHPVSGSLAERPLCGKPGPRNTFCLPGGPKSTCVQVPPVVTHSLTHAACEPGMCGHWGGT